MSLFQNLPGSQAEIAFPASLSEKYRPHTFADFVGNDKAKRVLTNFVARPLRNTAFLFSGPSGVGKTSAGIVLCEALRGELHHIPSQQCNLERIERTVFNCWTVPSNGTWHIVLIDEIDSASKAAQLALLSKTDATAFPPSTVFIFTCNSTEALEPRFLSRCMSLQFSSHGTANATAQLLERIWQAEAGQTAEQPNFLRLVRESGNNIRDAVNSLQVELLAA
jgi:DNA polymerase III subunit gamma/tau